MIYKGYTTVIHSECGGWQALKEGSPAEVTSVNQLRIDKGSHFQRKVDQLIERAREKERERESARTGECECSRERWCVREREIEGERE
jgi:hypothetical protein